MAWQTDPTATTPAEVGAVLDQVRGELEHGHLPTDPTGPIVHTPVSVPVRLDSV